jgi:hypothetical protein
MVYIWTKKHDVADLLGDHSVCGNAEYPDLVGSYHEVTFQHIEPVLKVTFGTTLQSSPDLAYWGLSDFSIYLK